jgi:hypothetical protein
MTDKPEQDHWLARPETIRKLWVALIAVLVLLLAAELVFPSHPHFALDAVFGFGAWVGFGACVVLVVVAKFLSTFNKRPDTYYDV